MDFQQRSSESVLTRSLIRPRFDDPALEAAWAVERLETFKRVNSRSLLFLAVMALIFTLLDLAFLDSPPSAIATRIGLFVMLTAVLVAVRRVTNVRTGDRLFAAACIGGAGLYWFLIFMTLPDHQLIDWWLVTLAMLGIVFMVLTEMAIWARLAVAGCLVLFGLAVPLTVAMPPQDAFLGMVHIVIVYAAGWAAVLQVETSRRLAFVRELDLEEERGRTVALLRNMLPTPIADRLLRSPDAIAEHHPAVTVLFADLVGFTPWASTRSAEEVVAVLDQIFTAFDELCDRHGVEKIKTIGDAYMAAGGVPMANGPTAPAVVRLGLDMIAAAETITTENDAALQLRIGVHEGSVVAGVIGRRKFLYDLWGDTVNTAARVESHGVPGRVHVTQGVADQLGDDFAVEERGTIDLKGKGPMVTHLVGRSDAL